jgi:hypothetical protein
LRPSAKDGTVSSSHEGSPAGASPDVVRAFAGKRCGRLPTADVEEAFAFFKGVPHELLFDRIRSVIIEGGRNAPSDMILRHRAPPYRRVTVPNHKEIA